MALCFVNIGFFQAAYTCDPSSRVRELKRNPNWYQGGVIHNMLPTFTHSFSIFSVRLVQCVVAWVTCSSSDWTSIWMYNFNHTMTKILSFFLSSNNAEHMWHVLQWEGPARTSREFCTCISCERWNVLARTNFFLVTSRLCSWHCTSFIFGVILSLFSS